MEILRSLENAEDKLHPVLENILKKKLGKDTGIKIVIILFSVICAVLIGLLAYVFRDESYLTDKIIHRPRDSNVQITIDALNTDENKKYSIDLNIDKRKYTKEEVYDNFQKVYDTLSNTIRGDNESLEKVSKNLNLITLADYDISIEWFSSNYDLIGYDGTVYVSRTDKNGENVILTALMKYEEYSREYTFDIKVLQDNTYDDSNIQNSIKKELENVLVQSKYQEDVELPEYINGHKIDYQIKTPNYLEIALGLGVIIAIFLFFSIENEKRNFKKNREKQMKYDYSEIVAKFNLLIGAGMSVQKAWEKIVLDYKSKRKLKTDYRYAYEEMLYTYFQIQSGLSVSKAYIEFANRCEIKEYRKLGNLLEQNIRKGNKGLLELLENEAQEAFEQRKNMARVLGEEAGTKLLFPMVMMLFVVMIIVMVPAFMSFNL